MRAKVMCDFLRKIGFVEVGFSETYREGTYRSRTLPLHKRDDCRRVNASRKKCPKRNVRNHLFGDRPR